MWWAIGIGIVLVILIIASNVSSGKSKNEFHGLQEMSLGNFQQQYHSGQLGNDFEGAYVIHNKTADKWYVNSSPKVYRAIAGRIGGKKGPPAIAQDIGANHDFRVIAVPLAGNQVDAREDLSHELREHYVADKKRY